MINEKSALRDANTARALAVVRFGHRPPARPPVANTQTHTDTQTGPITIHCAAKLSAQCKKDKTSKQRFGHVNATKPKSCGDNAKVTKHGTDSVGHSVTLVHHGTE